MAATEPIRNKEQLKDLANYFLLRGQYRNHAMIIMATCTALRISDLLRLRWSDVYDENHARFKSHVTLTEHKTGKQKTIALNKQIIQALKLYQPHRRGEHIFSNGRKKEAPISRVHRLGVSSRLLSRPSGFSGRSLVIASERPSATMLGLIRISRPWSSCKSIITLHTK